MSYPPSSSGSRSKLSLVDSLFNRSRTSVNSTPWSYADYKLPYQSHGGVYRVVDNLNVPFIPSPPRHPPRDLPPLDNGQVSRLLNGSREPRSSAVVRAGRKISKLSKDILKNRKQTRAVAHTEYLKRHHDHRVARRPSPLPLREWKTYGYYSKPCINNVWVDNSTTGKPPPPPRVDVAAIFDSLVEQGVEHPERWIAGLDHPSLPRRPPGWDTPDLTQPQPFPFELSVNPLFYSRPSCIRWNMAYSPECISYAEAPPCTFPSGITTLRWVPLNPSDLAQPATHPRIPFMHVTLVAPDMPFFPWPFWVKNKHGITVGDVLNQIYTNFCQFVGRRECDQWSAARRQRVFDACLTRYDEAVRTSKAKEGDQLVRRIDFLGGCVMFDALKPHPSGEGWVLSCRPRTPMEIHTDNLTCRDIYPAGGNISLTRASVRRRGCLRARRAARGSRPRCRA
ncbi:hypothetical protein HDZ31DRAFT_79981 [Schizophyllum fasciatum]